MALPEDPLETYSDMQEDLAGSPSIRVETWIKPNDIKQDSKDQIKQQEDSISDAMPTTTEAHFSSESFIRNSHSDFPYQFQNPFDDDSRTNRERVSLPKNITKLEPISERKPVHHQRPSPGNPGKFAMRKPIYAETPTIMQNKPHIPDDIVKTMLRPAAMVPRPTHAPTTHKKSVYRPIGKVPAFTRPVRMPSVSSKRPQNIILIKPQDLFPNEGRLVSHQRFKQKPDQKEHFDRRRKVPKIPHVEHIEISPQQASTEREPDTKQYAPLLSVKQEQEDEVSSKLPPAINTGFKPESIVIESGFKPILSKEVEERNDDEGPELEYESEIGVINVPVVENSDNSETKKAVESFEPVFIPSPLDKQSTQTPLKMRKRANPKKSHLLVIIKKQGRNVNNEDEDEIAEAAERVDSFYLPPPDKKYKPSDVPRKPLDIDVPPGTVVTYDGKKVSGASLTAKIADRGSFLESRASKAAELIMAGPQFAPYRGPDLPPLDSKYVNTGFPQLQSRALSRELDAPDVQAPTRLELRRQYEEEEPKRRKREAHHTPEHTAEQNKENEKTKTTSASNKHHTILCTSILFVIAFIIRLF